MKQITIKDTLGNKYTLEYNRKSVEILERQGFSPQKVSEQPMTMLPVLFLGAFYMHHKKTTIEFSNSLLEKVNDKQKLISTLLTMYNAPIEAMLDDPEDSEGNVTWEASE